MVRLTKEQNEVINNRDSNIIVSAAAGSGKTEVLTRRIISLMESENIDIDRFLIFTFTKAAANEMKDRVYKSFVKKINNKENEIFFRKQIVKINSANIKTIHSFCSDVIKDYFYLLDIDQNYKIGKENEFAIIKSNIIDEIFEKYYEAQDEKFLDVIEMFGGGRSDEKLRELLINIYKRSQSNPDWDNWKSNILTKYNDFDFWDKLKNRYVADELNRAVDYINETIKICSDDPNLSSQHYHVSEEFLKFKETIKGIEMDGTYKKIGFDNMPAMKNVDDFDKKRIKKLRDEYKKISGDIEKNFYSVITFKEQYEDFSKMKTYIEKLLDIVKIFKEKLFDEKKKKNILEYSDLEHLALKVLEDRDVQKNYKEYFKYIFIDEYQDSNYVQEELVTRIARGNNLFMVGDIKQSIYGFRLAEPEIFINKYNSFSNDKEEINYKIDLNKNFRSRENILDFTNTIFKNLMTKDFGKIDYDDNVKLYFGREDYLKPDDDIDIEIIKYKKSRITKEEAEVREIADKIEILVKNGASYKDIVVLMRSPKSYVDSMTDVFEKKKIPVFIDYSEKYLDSFEVEIVLNYLRLIDNMNQNIPLVSIMRTPIYGFTDDELFIIKKSKVKSDLATCVKTYKGNKFIEQKIEKMMLEIYDFRDRSKFLSIDKLIWEILSNTYLLEFIVSMPSGEKKLTNIRLLIEIAKEFEESSLSGLYQFNKYIKNVKEKKSDFEGAKTLIEKANVVRVMSIHKSKGLQFPIVILAGTGKIFNQSDSKGDILIHSKFGLISKTVDIENRVKIANVERKLILREIDLDSKSEEMRILYVGITRAIHKLIIFASVPSKNFDETLRNWKERFNPGGFKQNNKFIDWIMFSLYETVGDCDFKVNINEPIESGESFENRKIIIKEELKKMILDSEEHEYKSYDYEKKEITPAKVAVTTLVHDKATPKLERLGKRKDKKTEITGAYIGNQIHSIMQYLNLIEYKEKNNLYEQIEIMKKRNIVYNDIQDHYNLERVEDFLSSDLGKRLLSSTEIYKEMPFVMKEEINGVDALIEGIIDLFFIEDGKAIIIDFKTDSVTEKTYLEFMDKYSVQLNYYSKAIEKLTGYEVKERFVHFFKINKSAIVSSRSQSNCKS